MSKDVLKTVAKAIGAVSIVIPMAALPGAARAEPKPVKVALIAPFSGPWARSGEVELMGAKAAIEDINAAGGIKALGGAKMELIVADAGDSIEKSKSAAQRLVAQEPDLIGGTGAFLSSFTLAITEVTERAELPWLTLSYADSLTDRGYKYVFQTSANGSLQSETILPIVTKMANDAMGRPVKTLGIVMDNTASQVSFTGPMRDGRLEKMGIKLVTDEVFTPPLSDATSLVQKLRNTRPDFAFMLPSTVPDGKLLLEKISEMGLGQGKIPLIAYGGNMVVPELLKIVRKETLEGLVVAVANWPGKKVQPLVDRFKAKTGEPWMTQDTISTYGDMWIFKEALEKAGVADRKAVAAQIRAMDTDTGPAAYYPGERLRFDQKGRRMNAELVLVQWQDGVPVPVYPPSLATGTLKWPKK
jgi:branched-chain amino acid transport system substrate-binding protein